MKKIVLSTVLLLVTYLAFGQVGGVALGQKGTEDGFCASNFENTTIGIPFNQQYTTNKFSKNAGVTKETYAIDKNSFVCLSKSVSKVYEDSLKRNAISRSWSIIKQTITPIIGYKWGGTIIHKGDSLVVRSFEFGVGFNQGFIYEDASWGIFPMSWRWRYTTFPYVTMEYRWFKRIYEHQGSTSDNTILKPWMLNIGINSGKGRILSFLPIPFSIKGSLGVSTDFDQLYLQWGLAWDFAGLSVGLKGYHPIPSNTNHFHNFNYICTELNFVFIRE